MWCLKKKKGRVVAESDASPCPLIRHSIFSSGARAEVITAGSSPAYKALWVSALCTLLKRPHPPNLRKLTVAHDLGNL